MNRLRAAAAAGFLRLSRVAGLPAGVACREGARDSARLRPRRRGTRIFVAAILLLASCETVQFHTYRACLELPGPKKSLLRHYPGTVVQVHALGDGRWQYTFVPDAQRDRFLTVTCARCVNPNCPQINAAAAGQMSVSGIEREGGLGTPQTVPAGR